MSCYFYFELISNILILRLYGVPRKLLWYNNLSIKNPYVFISIDKFPNPCMYLISSYIGVVFILRLYLYIIDIARKDVNGLFYFLLFPFECREISKSFCFTTFCICDVHLDLDNKGSSPLIDILNFV